MVLLGLPPLFVYGELTRDIRQSGDDVTKRRDPGGTFGTYAAMTINMFDRRCPIGDGDARGIGNASALCQEKARDGAKRRGDNARNTSAGLLRGL